MSAQQYNVGGKTVGVYSGNGAAVRPPVGLVTQDEIDTMHSLQGRRAAGGPVSAGGTYLVGEKGPELLTMQGGGQVTNANSTASILSGGRDTLSLIEDHLYNAVQELRIHKLFRDLRERLQRDDRVPEEAGIRWSQFLVLQRRLVLFGQQFLQRLLWVLGQRTEPS